MEREIVAALSRCGRANVEAQLEERGFALHRLWQDRVLKNFCMDRCGDASRYWSEAALEKVRSAGLVSPDKREGFAEGTYRSTFLDELFHRMNYADSTFRSPPLVIGVGVPNWSGKKTDLRIYLDSFAVARGFACSGRRLTKRGPLGLIFGMRVDAGGNALLGNSLTLEFSIHHEQEPKFVWRFFDFDPIVPGFFWYRYCTSPQQHVFGIWAHVEMFEALCRSLDSTFSLTD